MRVLLAELAPCPAAVAKNLDRIEEVLAAAPCDLAVFPELFLSGYRLGDRFHQVALSRGDAAFERLRGIARARGTAVVVGAPVHSWERSGELQNTALLFGPNGNVEIQAKRFLPTFGPFEEGVHFTPAASSRPVRIGVVRAGLEICYDAFFPEVSRELALGGAELLVAISAAPITSRALFERILPARAIENALPVVYVNRVGVEDGLVFGGGSEALDSRGELLRSDPIGMAGLRDEEKLLAVEFDPSGATRWRPFRPVLRDVADRRRTARGDPEPAEERADERPPPLASNAPLIGPSGR